MNYFVLKAIRLAKHIIEHNLSVEYVSMNDYLFHEFKAHVTKKDDIFVTEEGSFWYLLSIKGIEIRFVCESWHHDPVNRISTKKISTVVDTYLVIDMYIKLLEE